MSESNIGDVKEMVNIGLDALATAPTQQLLEAADDVMASDAMVKAVELGVHFQQVDTQLRTVNQVGVVVDSHVNRASSVWSTALYGSTDPQVEELLADIHSITYVEEQGMPPSVTVHSALEKLAEVQQTHRTLVAQLGELVTLQVRTHTEAADMGREVRRIHANGQVVRDNL